MPETEDGDKRKEFLDRSFEVQKHTSTLSTAAALLILAVYRERPFEADLLAITLLLLALCALLSIQGMTAIALEERIPRRDLRPDPDSLDRYVYRLTGTATGILIAAVVAFALFLFDVPPWLAAGVLVVAFVALRLYIRSRRRKASRTRHTTSTRED